MPLLMASVDGAGSVRPPLLPVQPREVRPYAASRTSQLLFEAPVELPLTAEQSRRVLQLDFLKRWYLLCHLTYICTCILIGAGCLLLLQWHSDLRLVDAIFIATSSVCNCGLQTVDVGAWPLRTTLFRHALLLTGGVVVTSSFHPLLRLLMLHRVRSVFLPEETDAPLVAQLRATKQAEARRLFYTSLVSAVTPFVYLCVVNCVISLLLLTLNVSRLSLIEVLCMTVASFHSSIFLSMETYAGDAAVTGLVTLACALGFTAFPVVLRGFMWCEWRALRLVRRAASPLVRCMAKSRATRRSSSRANSSNPSADSIEEEGGRSAAHVESRDAEDEEGEEEVGEVSGESTWLLRPGRRLSSSPSLLDRLAAADGAFEEILTSTEPGTFHPFLFRSSETAFLGAAWVALTVMQAAPFWFEQWDGVLRGFSWPYKLYLSLCQAAVVRFAAASFVPLLELTNAHVAVTILSMYLPALPISTDRTYRKWKEMFRTSVVRLLTSKLFWLFVAMVLVVFAEEPRLRAEVRGSRFDIMTRALFEVISAYAGCGLSLSLPTASVSLVGVMGSFSKLVVAAVMVGGRHRFVDLGIDLGFSSLSRTA